MVLLITVLYCFLIGGVYALTELRARIDRLEGKNENDRSRP
jgi:hypothetical protein